MICPRRSENPGGVWRLPDEDTWRPDDDTCSYCGSYNPNKLMDAIRDNNVELGPTDKSYKVYLSFSTKKEKKFYFQHFSVAQQQEFIDLLNAKKVKLGYPGRFYVLPFFCQRLVAGEEGK
jgi:hypothetical protein